MNNTRKIYINKDKYITIIEIKKEDNYNLKDFLELIMIYLKIQMINIYIYIIHFTFKKNQVYQSVQQKKQKMI